MFKNKSFCTRVLIALIIVSSGIVSAQPPQPGQNNKASLSEKKPDQVFVRIKKVDNLAVALQTANVRYVPINGIPSDMHVDLISAIHIGDESYYQQLNELFKNYDAVLYESVSKGKKITRKPKQLKNTKPQGFISKLQALMASSLDLSFQMKIVDYTPDNFIHADLSPDEFFEHMDENDESFLGWGINYVLLSIKQSLLNPGLNNALNASLMMALMSPDRDKGLKIFAAEVLELTAGDNDLDPLKALEGKNGSTIITARNEKALQVLRQEIEKGKKTFAIFYGAGHFPEMEETLIKEFKLKKGQISWIDAWDLK